MSSPEIRPKRLVLFDIDGTILTGGPLWKECFLGALSELFPKMEFPMVPFGGKTDVQIAREFMAASGATEPEIDRDMQRVVDLYVARAVEAAKTRHVEVKIHPGVPEILESLANNNNVLLGLLTGNVRKGAHAKLSCVGLDHYFKIGVYGDDHWDRYKLPQIAVDRVRAETGHAFSGKQIVIIGDTVHDVNCGKSIGVRSIAVGTGHKIYADQLLSQNPDYYFKDMGDTFEVLQAILEEL